MDKRNIKGIFSTLCFLLILVTCIIPCTAYPTQKEHDKDLKYVLFGNRDYFLDSNKQDSFQAIADAAAIFIDQFSTTEGGTSKKEEYESLKKRVNLSYSFDEINLDSTKSKNNRNISSTTHRAYTHNGWNFSEYPNKPFWEKRKTILIITVEHELFPSGFEIPIISDILPDSDEKKQKDKQCEAFCELVYYVHMLGDHIEAKKSTSLTQLVPISSTNDKTRPGIIPDILDCLVIWK